jgi:hypothetical protein
VRSRMLVSTRHDAIADELRRDMAVHSLTAEIAELAGRIEGEQARVVSALLSWYQHCFRGPPDRRDRVAHELRRGHTQRAPLPVDPRLVGPTALVPESWPEVPVPAAPKSLLCACLADYNQQ